MSNAISEGQNSNPFERKEGTPLIPRELTLPRSRRLGNSSIDTAVVNGEYYEFPRFAALDHDPEFDKKDTYVQIGTRPLNTENLFLNKLLYALPTKFLDEKNLELNHEQFLSSDGLNFGKTKREIVKDSLKNVYFDPNSNEYNLDKRKFSPKYIYRAFGKMLEDPMSRINSKYGLFLNNCQDTIDAVETAANEQALAEGRHETSYRYSADDYFRRYTHGMRIGNLIVE